MRFENKQYAFETNVAANRAAYAKLSIPDCSCENCRNFCLAVRHAPEALVAFFDSLGLSIEKSANVSSYSFGEKENVLYEGMYHLSGTIERIPMCAEPFEIAGASVHFHNNLAMVPEGFPFPHFQMEVFFRLPWVLDDRFTPAR